MYLTKDEFKSIIKTFSFKDLFISMGWDTVKLNMPVALNDLVYNLNAVAQKKDFVIFTCESKTLPASDKRKKIEREVTKRFLEHIIIFYDISKNKQIWQTCIREPNKPYVIREITYHLHQTPELLFQKLRGLVFTLEEEDKIGLVDVVHRVSESFNINAERVTKRFYDRFKKEHITFLNFIEGINDVVDREWYASLMLNRLMFIYFIQKKGFLDDDRDYLRNRLKASQEKWGSDKFYSFYRKFLLVLFHKGLGSPERDEALLEEIGRVPYLDGGLFDVHRIENNYEKIQIKDEAFENIFNFFDQYQWHLDTRITASGRDINPDVIGYIFEKYINDRAALGAYYTKEDITEYISKSCIIPRLFEETRKRCAVAFQEGSSLWRMLQENPDRYIYPSVRKGRNLELPPEIENGVDTTKPDLIERRKCWNTPAPEEYALPTEIWREVVERRTRYFDVRKKLENGEIRNINDFITYNLDIRQFAQDAVEQYEGSDFINAFYKAVKDITILDPTCGSGAFLFAALNVLEPLYESCLDRMQTFVDEEEEKGGKRFSQFREVLEIIEQHPNRRYFIYKTIILQNLYGVDIMNEAVEIAKLRLFLKLMAEVDRFEHIEPLPDIDFNIRAGNTLVGFATEQELHDAIVSKLDFDETEKVIHEKMSTVALAFKRYKEIQLEGEEKKFQEYKDAKDELYSRLDELNEELNIYLAGEYGIDPERKRDYIKWKNSHKPFHWLAEYYEIIKENEGFDVIIGNPPYIIYNSKKIHYEIKNLFTLECKDLYAFIIEKAIQVIQKNGFLGMITPISIVSTEGFNKLRQLMCSNLGDIFFSHYAMRPGKLFDGAENHLTIFVANKSKHNKLLSTKYHRWYAEEREYLFENLVYVPIDKSIIYNNSIPKLGSQQGMQIFNKLLQNKPISNYLLKKSNYRIFHTRKLRYFLQFLDCAPKIYEDDGSLRITSELKSIYFKNNHEKYIGLAAFLSSIFFWYFITYSDCRNLNRREVFNFPFSLNKNSVK